MPHYATQAEPETRLSLSNITIDGVDIKSKLLSSNELCRGCAHGGTRQILRRGVTHRRERSADEQKPRTTFYGQLVHSDTTTGFPKSFPHGFTGMVNFCDDYTGERRFYNLVRPQDPIEVASAFREYHKAVRHHLKDGKIWAWRTDNGSEFKGDAIDGAGGVVEETTVKREFSIANDRNKNPVAERAWGVIQRGIRTCLAHAEAPHCLWAWAANQCALIYDHLATTIHSPPTSLHDFMRSATGPTDPT